MTALEHAAASLQGNLEILKMTLSDFSDADMLVRPCSGANHAAWQVGHLVCSENHMIGAAAPGAMPALAAGFADKFTKETAAKNDGGFFPRKEELLEIYARQRAAVIAWVKQLAEADLDRPSPESYRSFVPTIGALILLTPMHLGMHLGQIQVIRRKLGKPVLF